MASRRCKSELALLRLLKKRRLRCPEPMHARGMVLNAEHYAMKGQCKIARRLARKLIDRCWK